MGDTAGGPVEGWGVDGTAGNQPRGTKLWFNYARELGIINKQSALCVIALKYALHKHHDVAAFLGLCVITMSMTTQVLPSSH